MKLFFTAEEIYKSSIVHSYFHEMSTGAESETDESRILFSRLKEKLQKVFFNSRMQVFRFAVSEKLDLYFMDFELVSSLDLSESDFRYSTSAIIALHSRLKTGEETNPHCPDYPFYSYPFRIEPEEKFGTRVRLVLLNWEPSILFSEMDVNFLQESGLKDLKEKTEARSGVFYFTQYPEYLIQSFVQSFEKMILSKKYRNDFLYFRCIELLAVLFENSRNEKMTESCKIRISEYDEMKIRKARDILISNSASPPTIPQLARQVGINELKLKTGFKKLYSDTIYNYLSSYRMEKAKYMLQSENKSVTEAAVEAGYSSFSKFSNAFRKKFGVNPSYFKSKGV